MHIQAIKLICADIAMLLSCKQLHLLGQNRMKTCCHNIHTWYKKNKQKQPMKQKMKM